MNFRGKSVQDIYDASQERFTQFAIHGIRKFVLSIGTVNLLNMAKYEITPEDAATDVINTIKKFVSHLSSTSQLVYIMPAPNAKISSRSYSSFTLQISDFTGEQNIKTVSACYQMVDTVYSIHHKNLFDDIEHGSYDQVVHLCATDGLH